MPTLHFDATTVAPSVPMEALPSGQYLVEITGSEMKPNKSGDGTHLALEFTVLDGEFRNRKVWNHLCLNHSSQKTVEIARANLSAICHAVGVLKPHDSHELHHLPLTIKVVCKNGDDGQIRNDIKGYAKYERRTQYVSTPAITAPSVNTAPYSGDTEIPF
ncbi:MAG: DUF669 domain-containing protein [Thermoguttaceae bacterium]